MSIGLEPSKPTALLGHPDIRQANRHADILQSAGRLFVFGQELCKETSSDRCRACPLVARLRQPLQWNSLTRFVSFSQIFDANITQFQKTSSKRCDIGSWVAANQPIFVWNAWEWPGLSPCNAPLALRPSVVHNVYLACALPSGLQNTTLVGIAHHFSNLSGIGENVPPMRAILNYTLLPTSKIFIIRCAPKINMSKTIGGSI